MPQHDHSTRQIQGEIHDLHMAFICLYIYTYKIPLPIYYLFIYFIYLFVYLCIYLFIYLFTAMVFIWFIWFLDTTSEEARVCEEVGCQRAGKEPLCAVAQ